MLIEKDKVLVEQNNFIDADKLIQRGYQVIFFKNLNNDFVNYAKSIHCKYVFKNNELIKV